MAQACTTSKAGLTAQRSEVQTFSGAALPAVFGGNNTNSTGIVRTDIDANRTLVTDQAGKSRISKTSALGQLEEVWEVLAASEPGSESVAFPNTSIAHGFKTTYSYDTLSNLTTVNQGSQQRDFTYSSLSRLLSATNPESGTIGYEYDPNGNLTEKTDARSIVTTYTYDELNRVTARDYSDTTPDVDYTYGTSAPKVGKLVKVESSVSTTEYTGFDILGRVTAHKQTTDGQSYTTGYVYNLSGALIEQAYPSGRVVKNVLDNNGDLSLVQSKKNSAYGFFTYANSFTYNPAGAVTSMQLGNGRWESTQFNSRLQPTQIALGVTQGATNLLDLDYSYGTTNNNGNVLSQDITVKRSGQSDLVFNQTYTYDALNRIKAAEEKTGTTTNWRQTFVFDRYGNRNFDTTSGATTTLPENFDPNIYNPTVNTANNRFASGQDWSYDAAGNVIGDPEGRTFTYDAENKQTEVEDSSSQTIGEYFLDGDGKRVKKHVPSTGEVTVFVYDAGGKLVAEYSTIVASTNDATVAYLTNDHLGSPRINTDANGSVTARHDYHPFGEEIYTSQRTQALDYTADTIRKQFTGYHRDEETELDYAGLRIYSNKLGRFFSADPIAPDILTPLTLNRYEYCLNNPLRFVDTGGGYEEDVHRDLTAALAYVVGFSEQQGNIIGAANQWLDDPKSGHTPMPGVNPGDITGYYGRRDYHFTTEERRGELWQSFESEIAAGGVPLAALGTFLHAQQDSLSHEGFGPGVGQVYAAGDNFDITQPVESIRNRMKEMEKYDKTNYDPGKAVKMARDTLAKLLAARNAMEKSGRFGAFRKPIPWETDKFINDKLWQWARTTGATPEEERNNKRNVLFEIMRYATSYGSPTDGVGRSRKKRTKTRVRVVKEEE